MARLEVLKTYKIYIGGKFPRTESGRYYTPENKGKKLGNICLSSRKDFRNAVVAARGAFEGWSGKTAFNRSQILYRIAEMLEGRTEQFVHELQQQGSTKKAATLEVETAVDRLVYHAGWADKLSQVFGSVNPVAGTYFNFSVHEPQGVVVAVAPEDNGLIGLVTMIAETICTGNTCIAVASESMPLCSITFAEVLNSSDVPGGVVNILTGTKEELLPHIGSHMDVNAVLFGVNDADALSALKKASTGNLKRIYDRSVSDWMSQDEEHPYNMLNVMEVKTTWHPIEHIAASGSAY